MRKKQIIDFLLAFCGGTVALIGYFYLEGVYRTFTISAGILLVIVFLILMLMDIPHDVPSPSDMAADEKSFSGKPVEVALLNEENQPLATWTLYGKTGLVIGRDVGENQVNINLTHSTYASTVDVEHAVLNYAGQNWYVEDLNSKNGVSVQKQDERKYRLAPGHPCKLSSGDILYIGLVRLLVR